MTNIVRVLLFAALLLAGVTSSAQDLEWDRVISSLKTLSANLLDPAAPGVPLEVWLQRTLGEDTVLAWTPSDCDLKPDPPEPPEGYPVCVVIRAKRPDRVWVKLHILVGTTRTGLVALPEYQPQSFMGRPRFRCLRDDEELRCTPKWCFEGLDTLCDLEETLGRLARDPACRETVDE